MTDKLGKLFQAMESGKTKEGLSTPSTSGLGGSDNGLRKAGVKHTWKTNAFGTIGSVRAKKRGSGKH